MPECSKPTYPLDDVDEEFTCLYCAHFRPHYGETFDLEKVELGWCHRRSPSPMVVAVGGGECLPTVDVVWPTVDSFESCGDFEPRE